MSIPLTYDFTISLSDFVLKGKSREAMLNEVRKEAFSMRKARSISSVDDEEEDESVETPSTASAEEWSTWYPQE